MAKAKRVTRTSKPAVSKPVAFRIGANTHKAASATKRGVKKVGTSVAGFFKNLAAGWKAA